MKQGDLGMSGAHDQAGDPGVDDPRNEDGSLVARRCGNLGEQACDSWGVDPGASQERLLGADAVVTGYR